MVPQEHAIWPSPRGLVCHFRLDTRMGMVTTLGQLIP